MCVENAWSSERKELVEGPPAAFRDNVWAKKTQSTSTPVCSGKHFGGNAASYYQLKSTESVRLPVRRHQLKACWASAAPSWTQPETF